MSYAYQPAAGIDDLLKAVISHYKGNLLAPSANPGTMIQGPYGNDVSSLLCSTWSNSVSSVMPRRRKHSDVGNSSARRKRPKLGSVRRASEFSRPSPNMVIGRINPSLPVCVGCFPRTQQSRYPVRLNPDGRLDY